jgi:hypothetical protein
MMRPGNIQDYYSDYLEGRLGQAARRRFEEILDSHPDRKADYELFAKTHHVVTHTSPEAAEPGFESRVLSRLADSREKRAVYLLPFRPLSLGTVGAAAAAAVLVAAVLVVVNWGPGEPGVPEAVQPPTVVAERAGEPDGSLTAGSRIRPEVTPQRPPIAEVLSQPPAVPAERGRRTPHPSGRIAALPPGLQQRLLADPTLARQVEEIADLIEKINALNRDFDRQEYDSEFVVHASGNRELVLRPSVFYRQAARSADHASLRRDVVEHAY